MKAESSGVDPEVAGHGRRRASIQVRRGQGAIEATVHNEGAPIADDLLPIIFEHFSSAAGNEAVASGWVSTSSARRPGPRR
jgi:hypothetical protein